MDQEQAVATKTISIDIEAYNRLAQARLANESFSQVIKRVVRPPFDLEAWLRTVRENSLNDLTLDAVEEHVSGRRQRSRRSA
jgi:predicted CopG family antitoxin